MSEKSSHMDLDGVEHHETGTVSENCRNRALSVQSCKNAESRAETTSLLRAHLPDDDNDDDDNDSEFAVQRAVPSTSDDTPQTSSFLATSNTQSNDLRRRWRSLKRWFTPSCSPSPAIRLDELRARHRRLPVRTDDQPPCR